MEMLKKKNRERLLIGLSAAALVLYIIGSVFNVWDGIAGALEDGHWVPGLLKLAVCSLPFIAAFTLSVLSAKLENINKRVYLLIMLGVLTFLSLIPLVSELNTRAPGAYISYRAQSYRELADRVIFYAEVFLLVCIPAFGRLLAKLFSVLVGLLYSVAFVYYLYIGISGFMMWDTVFILLADVFLFAALFIFATFEKDEPMFGPLAYLVRFIRKAPSYFEVSEDDDDFPDISEDMKSITAYAFAVKDGDTLKAINSLKKLASDSFTDEDGSPFETQYLIDCLKTVREAGDRAYKEEGVMVYEEFWEPLTRLAFTELEEAPEPSEENAVNFLLVSDEKVLEERKLRRDILDFAKKCF